MPDLLQFTLNGRACEVPAGTTVAAAMLRMGEPTRISVTGTPRAALCGMGICFECCAVVNGIPHRRTCQLLCEPGMVVETGQ